MQVYLSRDLIIFLPRKRKPVFLIATGEDRSRCPVFPFVVLKTIAKPATNRIIFRYLIVCIKSQSQPCAFIGITGKEPLGIHVEFSYRKSSGSETGTKKN